MPNSDSASAARAFNTRLGLILFFLYLLLYLGFVLISAFSPDVMERIVALGLNLAVVYGFALIAVAFVMSLIYGLLCRNDSESGDDQ